MKSCSDEKGTAWRRVLGIALVVLLAVPLLFAGISLAGNDGNRMFEGIGAGITCFELDPIYTGGGEFRHL